MKCFRIGFTIFLFLIVMSACKQENGKNEQNRTKTDSEKDSVSLDTDTGTNSLGSSASIDKKEETEKLIELEHPQPNSNIDSVLFIQGRAKGYWFFEGDFPIELRNARGKTVLENYVSAEGNWMTENYVDFQKQLVIPDSLKGTHFLILNRANPSGLEKHADSLKILIRLNR